MTTVEDASALFQAPVKRSILDRPRSTTGAWSWFTTVDHKKIAIMYGTTAMFFFLVGGIEALMLRIQLAQPNGTFLSAARYNEFFTMHGTTMIFLMGMPLAAAFGNYFIPLMIGARDVAFPRLEHVRLLGVPLRRNLPVLLVRARWRPGRRLVRLRAAHQHTALPRFPPRSGRRLLGCRPDHVGRRLGRDRGSISSSPRSICARRA